jgi:alpha-D-ribose 1-methylphosphonate 5-triphosphate diphosphatase PhnM
MSTPNIVQGGSVRKILENALEAGQGLLRLVSNWVPRSFLHPGKRIKLHPDDYKQN